MQRAYQHLQVENGQLREEIVRLQDKESTELGGHVLVRSSPDGQDIDRQAAQHKSYSCSSSITNITEGEILLSSSSDPSTGATLSLSVEQLNRAECEELGGREESEEDGQISEDETEINRYRTEN